MMATHTNKDSKNIMHLIKPQTIGAEIGVWMGNTSTLFLKNNLKNAWWKSTVYNRDDVQGLDTSILTHPDVLKYSGHQDTFTDPLVDCKSCGLRFREDQIPEQCIGE